MEKPSVQQFKKTWRYINVHFLSNHNRKVKYLNEPKIWSVEYILITDRKSLVNSNIHTKYSYLVRDLLQCVVGVVQTTSTVHI